MTNSEQRTANSEQRTANSEQRTANSEQRTANSTLSKAKKAKQDEFYTQLGDIENELRHYRSQLEGKVIYCNCDDPFESHFFKYFALNFNFLKLKKLIATSYVKSPIAGNELPLFAMLSPDKPDKQPIVVEINQVTDLNGDGATDLVDVRLLLEQDQNTSHPLKGDSLYAAGDFRSTECVELLKQADIVVTNPPFSLFREYVAQLIEYDKKFVIVGSKNAITYKEIFKLIKDNKLWIGNGFMAGNAYFKIPTENAREFATGVYDDTTGLVKFRNVGWFTNLDHQKRHESLILFRKYNTQNYPHYDNYNAIEVSKVADIPCDYDGAMGVPITFLDKFNPQQFEILGLTTGRYEFDKLAHPIKRYVNSIQINPDGSEANGSKANTRATFLNKQKPISTYYVADNCEGYLTIVYARILIKNKGLQQ